MPIYTYQCDCGKIIDEYRSIDNRYNLPVCDCGHKMQLKIMPTQIAPVLGGGDFQGYKCPVTEKWVTSRKERKNIMAEHNLIEVGDRKRGEGKMASGYKPGERDGLQSN